MTVSNVMTDRMEYDAKLYHKERGNALVNYGHEFEKANGDIEYRVFSLPLNLGDILKRASNKIRSEAAYQKGRVYNSLFNCSLDPSVINNEMEQIAESTVEHIETKKLKCEEKLFDMFYDWFDHDRKIDREGEWELKLDVCFKVVSNVDFCQEIVGIKISRPEMILFRTNILKKRKNFEDLVHEVIQDYTSKCVTNVVKAYEDDIYDLVFSLQDKLREVKAKTYKGEGYLHMLEDVDFFNKRMKE